MSALFPTMPNHRPRYSAEETARRGDEIYARAIRPRVEPAHYGKVVAIDIDSESYLIDENALVASERLLEQYPKAGIWCVRIGHCVVYNPIHHHPNAEELL